MRSLKELTRKSGQLAIQAQVNVEARRCYERSGLLPEPAPRLSGYREYPAEDVQVVLFIKRAQDLGFTLAEMKQRESKPRAIV